MAVGISETANQLVFSCITIKRVYRDWSKKEKISTECLVTERGQRGMDILVQDDGKAAVT